MKTQKLTFLLAFVLMGLISFSQVDRDQVILEIGTGTW
jgi:hypothetical protein